VIDGFAYNPQFLATSARDLQAFSQTLAIEKGQQARSSREGSSGPKTGAKV